MVIHFVMNLHTGGSTDLLMAALIGFHWFDGEGDDFIYDNNEMMAKWLTDNCLLLPKVLNILRPYVQSVEPGGLCTIEKTVPMEIENGSGLRSGYGSLHGANMYVGGFRIKGKITKGVTGVVTTDIIYQWNDIQDLHGKLYKTDKMLSEAVEGCKQNKDGSMSDIDLGGILKSASEGMDAFARDLAKNGGCRAEDYILRISWRDISTTDEDGDFVTGWLAGRWEYVANDVSSAYSLDEPHKTYRDIHVSVDEICEKILKFEQECGSIVTIFEMWADRCKKLDPEYVNWSYIALLLHKLGEKKSERTSVIGGV